jgi:hypothetical protein
LTFLSAVIYIIKVGKQKRGVDMVKKNGQAINVQELRTMDKKTVYRVVTAINTLSVKMRDILSAEEVQDFINEGYKVTIR